MKLFLIISLGILALGVLHSLGIILLYQTVSWYDAFLHGLSGAWIGLVVLVWLKQESYSRSHMDIFLALGIVALLGILWEFFEFGVDTLIVPLWNIPMLQGDITDTMSDLFMDLFGGGVGALTFRFIHRRNTAVKERV